MDTNGVSRTTLSKSAGASHSPGLGSCFINTSDSSSRPGNVQRRPLQSALHEFPRNMAASDFKMQRLYDPSTYALQFTYRYNTARTHIRQVFSENWSP